VTIEHRPQQRKHIGEQIRSLPRGFRHRVIPAFTMATLIHPPPLKYQETSQRLRGFFFCAVAGAVASRMGLGTVEVLENGIGAVNAPPLEAMLWGGLATRGAHPRFLRLIGRLVSIVAYRNITYELPFKWWTKGEMVRRAIACGAEASLAWAVSCVHYPLRQPGPRKQCGVCPACLGHVQAMHAAGSTVTAHTFDRPPVGSAGL